MATCSFDREYILEDTPENRKLVHIIESEPTGHIVKVKRFTPPSEKEKIKFKKKFMRSMN